jgi:hypothetical protein
MAKDVGNGRHPTTTAVPWRRRARSCPSGGVSSARPTWSRGSCAARGLEGIGISRASGLVPDANLHLSHLRVGQVEGDRFSGAAEMSGAGRTDARAQRAEVGWAGADCQPGGGRWGGLGAGPIIPTNGTP